ncbi:MAG TPA: type II secretion system protein [Candidatus Limihabitans stercoravium]|nr:type II secretion system protein [Candidatus Limihabitans stercoravium]
MKRKNNKAFTITELVIVIAVVAILAAVLIPTFSNVIEKANQSNDTVLVKNLNTALSSYEALNGKPSTMHEALTAVAEEGFLVEKLTPRSSGEILWEQTSNRFVLVKDNAIVFGDASTTANLGYTYWKIVKEMPTENANNYSLYLADGFTTEGALAVSGGIDVGNNSDISINYTNTTSEAQDVVFRTNGGTFIVNGELDTVSHYGTIHDIAIEQVAPHSYHEYGEVLSNMTISKGNVVIENTAVVPRIVVSGTETITVEINSSETDISVFGVNGATITEGMITNNASASVNEINDVDVPDASVFAGGKGTQAEPYIVTTNAQLEAIANYKGIKYHYQLGANLNDVNNIVLEETDIEFDLNGYSIETAVNSENSAAHYYLFNNYGVFTLKDTSDSQTGAIRARGLQNYNLMTIESGNLYTIDSNGGGACVWNETDDLENPATLYVYGGSFYVTGSPSGNMVACCINNQANSKAYIYGANFVTYYLAVVNSGYMEVTDSAVSGDINITPSTNTWWNSFKTYSGSELIMENITSNLSSSSLLENAGGRATLINCNVNQLGKPGQSYGYQANCIAVSGNGETTIKGGNYYSVAYGLYVYSSGGTFNIYDAEIEVTGDLPAIKGDIDSSSYPNAKINMSVYNSTITGKWQLAKNSVVNIYSGVLQNSGLTLEQVNGYLAEGSTATESNGTFTISQQ